MKERIEGEAELYEFGCEAIRCSFFSRMSACIFQGEGRDACRMAGVPRGIGSAIGRSDAAISTVDASLDVAIKIVRSGRNEADEAPQRLMGRGLTGH